MVISISRDHFIIGYEDDNIIFVRNKNDWGFDYLPRLGYDVGKAITSTNNLTTLAHKTKRELLNPLRKNMWKKPSITLVSSSPFITEEAIHLYLFCKLIGGINISLVHVHSVVEFLKNPHYKLIRTHYMLVDENKPYDIQEKHFEIVK